MNKGGLCRVSCHSEYGGYGVEDDHYIVVSNLIYLSLLLLI